MVELNKTLTTQLYRKYRKERTDVTFVLYGNNITEVQRLLIELNQDKVSETNQPNAVKKLQTYLTAIENSCSWLIKRDNKNRFAKEAKEKLELVVRKCLRIYQNHSLEERKTISSKQTKKFLKVFIHGLNKYCSALVYDAKHILLNTGVVGGLREKHKEVVKIVGVDWDFALSEDFVNTLNSDRFNNDLAQIRQAIANGPREDQATKFTNNKWVKYGSGRSNIRIYGSREGTFPRIRLYKLIRNNDQEKGAMDTYCCNTPVNKAPFKTAI